MMISTENSIVQKSAIGVVGCLATVTLNWSATILRTANTARLEGVRRAHIKSAWCDKEKPLNHTGFGDGNVYLPIYFLTRTYISIRVAHLNTSSRKVML